MTARPAARRPSTWLAASVFLVTPVLGCSGSSGSARAFCDSLRAGGDPVAMFAAAGSDPSQMPAAVARLRELEGKAPSSIKGSVADLVGVALDVQTALVARAQQSSGQPPATVPTGDANKAQTASASVTRFASSTCGVDLASSTASS